jgi:hypothetical protein
MARAEVDIDFLRIERRQDARQKVAEPVRYHLHGAAARSVAPCCVPIYPPLDLA